MIVEYAGISRNGWKSLFNLRSTSDEKPLYCFRVSTVLASFLLLRLIRHNTNITKISRSIFHRTVDANSFRRWKEKV